MSRLFGPVRQTAHLVRDIERAMQEWMTVMGVGPFFYLKDRPRDAAWLSKPQQTAIAEQLAAESPPAGGRSHNVWKELCSREVFLLSAAYFGLVSTLNTNATWVPSGETALAATSPRIGGFGSGVDVGRITPISMVIRLPWSHVWSRSGGPSRRCRNTAWSTSAGCRSSTGRGTASGTGRSA